ncbi:MAG: hemerythrin domain-containing protein [Vicinamibacteria bacterium]
MERHSFFRQIHKGIRAVASALEAEAGRTDFRSREEVQALQRKVDEAFSVFESHAEHENEHFLPLLRVCAPDVAADCEADHRAQELRLRDLRTALSRAAAGGAKAVALGHAFVLGLSRFHGEMLVHMADEEERLMPALWAAFDDAALQRVHRVLLESLSPAEKLASMRFMLPALAGSERVALLAGLRDSAPLAAFEAIARVAREVLPREEWARLESDLALAA